MGVAQTADFARNSILNSSAGATLPPVLPAKGEGEQGSLQGTGGHRSISAGRMSIGNTADATIQYCLHTMICGVPGGIPIDLVH